GEALGREAECLLAVGRVDHLIAGSREAVADQFPHVLLVVGHEDRRFGVAHVKTSSRIVRGSSTTNTVPGPSSSASSSVPPWLSAMALLMASPSPVPVIPLAVAVDAR